MVVVIAFDNSLYLAPHEERAALLWRQAGSKCGSLSAMYSVPMIWNAVFTLEPCSPVPHKEWSESQMFSQEIAIDCILWAKVCSARLCAGCSREQCAACRCNKTDILTPGLWSTIRSLLCSINSPVFNMSPKRSESAEPFLQLASV